MEDVWAPLDGDRSEIRLLLLRANDNVHAWPQAALQIRSLNHALYYEAISYAWGGSQPSMPLFIETAEGLVDMPITANLCAALQHLRHPREDKCFWVDAVSISQKDTSEREQQIGLMHQIFHRANLVHVWLSAVGIGAERAISKLNMVRHTTDQASVEYWRGSEAHDAMTLIGDASYWSRLWVAGEMILGRDVVIHCNLASIDVASLKAGFNFLRCATGPWGQGLRRLLPMVPGWATYLLKLRSVLPQSMNATLDAKGKLLLTVLNETRVCTVSDPRDRINGFLGLFNSFFNHDEQADYTSSVANVFTRFAKSLIYETRSLRILTQANPFQNTTIGLPSWVPDFGAYYNHQPQLRDLHLWDVFSACPSLTSSTEQTVPPSRPSLSQNINPSVSFSVENHLKLEGCIWATVSTVGQVWYNTDREDILSSQLAHWEKFYSSIDEQFTLASPECAEAFVRTLLNNVYPSGVAAHASIDALQMMPAAPVRLHPHRLKHIFKDGIKSSSWTSAAAAAANAPAASSSLLRTHFPAYQLDLVDRVCFQVRTYDRGEVRMRMGVGPRGMAPGDVIALFPGANLPFVLRCVPGSVGSNDGKTFTARLVGSCYVHGIMDGELFLPDNEEFQIRTTVVIV